MLAFHSISHVLDRDKTRILGNKMFQKRSFVLLRVHENQNVATISTLVDQFMLKGK